MSEDGVAAFTLRGDNALDLKSHKSLILPLSRSLEDLSGLSELAPDKLVRSNSLEQLDLKEMAANSRNKPTSLATVLENMPLVYNSATKKLELNQERRQLILEEPETTTPPAETSQDKLEDSSPIKGKVGNFKRGHVRHSSYETAQLTLLPAGQANNIGRTNSLHRTTDSLSSSVSIGSLSFYSDDCSAVSGETARTGDSGIGDGGSSKRSSLDRRSQCSAVDWSDAPLDSSPGKEGTLLHSLTDKTRRRGLPLPSISLPRGLFSRKGTAPWKLFGNHSRPAASNGIPSTTGLILEDRPANLPAKSDAEIEKHKQQYAEIIEAVRRKDQKEAKERRKAQEQRKKLEDQISADSRQWSDVILPKWTEMRNTKRCRELWWRGLPPGVRGKVWNLAIGNELNLTKDLYEICLSRAREKLSECDKLTDYGESTQSCCSQANSPTHAREDCSSCAAINREDTMELIHLDVARTFPSLGLFQKGPYYDLLLNLLSAYVCYRPDVGYVQSMSLVAAVLLLNLEPSDAFVAFANLLNRPLQLAFYRMRQPQMTHYFIAYDQYLAKHLPTLHAHLDAIDVRPDLYLIEWLYTLYAKSVPIDVTCHIWDVYLRDGEDFLFETALGLLHMYESELLAMDFDCCVQFLTHLPDSISGECLFEHIEPFVRIQSFQSVLADVTASVGERLSPCPSFCHARKGSDTSSLTSANSVPLKMSKSLSGLLGDWLNPEPAVT